MRKKEARPLQRSLYLMLLYPTKIVVGKAKQEANKAYIDYKKADRIYCKAVKKTGWAY